MPIGRPGLRDDLPMDEWQRLRNMQGGDAASSPSRGAGQDELLGGAGEDHLSPRPSQIGSPQQAELRGVQAAASLFGRAVDVVKALTPPQSRKADPAPDARSQAAPPAARPTYTRRDAALDLGAKHVLERIALGEQPDQPVSYDVTYGYGAFVPPGSKKLTEMTFEEVAALQKEMLRRQEGRRGRASSPVGKYQFMPETIDDLRAKLGLKSTDRFTPGVQDLMARELLTRRGYDDFVAGKIDAATLQDRLAAEWASVARPSTGKSYYGQPVGTTTEQMRFALEEARKEAQRRISEGGLNPYARRWR